VRDAEQSLEMEIWQRLNAVKDPCSVAARRPLGLVDMGLVERVDVDVAAGSAVIGLRLTSPGCYLVTAIRSAIRRELAGCSGVQNVEIAVDDGLNWDPSMIAPVPPSAPTP